MPSTLNTKTHLLLTTALMMGLMAGCLPEEPGDLLVADPQTANEAQAPSTTADSQEEVSTAEPTEPGGAGQESSGVAEVAVPSRTPIAGAWSGVVDYEQSLEVTAEHIDLASSGERTVAFTFDESGIPASLPVGGGFEFDLRDLAVGRTQTVVDELVVGGETVARDVTVELVELEAAPDVFYARFVWNYSGLDALTPPQDAAAEDEYLFELNGDVISYSYTQFNHTTFGSGADAARSDMDYFESGTLTRP